MFSSLPNELKEEILLGISSPRELISLCSSSKEFYSLCSQRGFWVRKFRQEDLPLLGEGGNDLSTWLYIYKRSLVALEKTRQVLKIFNSSKEPGVVFSGDISRLISLEPLYYLGLSVNLESWQMRKEIFKLVSLLRLVQAGKAERLRKKIFLLRDYTSSITIKRENGEYYLDYSYSTPQTPPVLERVHLTPSLLKEFLYRYYFFEESNVS